MRKEKKGRRWWWGRGEESEGGRRSSSSSSLFLCVEMLSEKKRGRPNITCVIINMCLYVNSVCVCVCFYTHFLVAWRWFPIWTRRTEKRRRKKEEEEKVKGMRAVFNFQKLSISPHLGLSLSLSLFLSSTPLEMKRERERRSFRGELIYEQQQQQQQREKRRRRGGGGERWTAFTFRRCASKWRRRRDGREECSVHRPPTHSNTDDSISY